MPTLMSQEVKDYFAHGQKKITKIVAKSDYQLILYYSDDSVKLYDLSGSLHGIFEKLEDEELFSKVFIDDSGAIAWDLDPTVDSSLVWSNRIDICPDAAYLASVDISNQRLPI